MMQDENRTKEQLARELQELRERVRELEQSEAECLQMEKGIREQTDFLNLVLESIPHPFYVIDASDYTIKLANSATYAGTLKKGTTCHELTHRRDKPCESDEHPCPLRIVKETKKPVTVEHVHYDEDGNAKNVEIHAYPIFDEDGNVIQVIESSIDITERRKAQEALKKSSEEIKLFAYSVVHDLRSPSVGIYVLTERLNKGYRHVLDERAKGYCDQILEASRQIALLVSNINIYVSSKEIPLTIESLRLGEILQIVKDEFSPQLDIRQIGWSQPQNMPEIRADRLSLLRVFRNLVDNALKYGGEDLSQISIAYQEQDGFHVVSVSDDGVGIKGKDSEKIFEVFQRDETSVGTEGTGLGLAIVREVAEQHGGKVKVESGPDKGTTFYISISKQL
ncbi:MAG: PAS domain-containing sensor histidine kinase [Deltaproteobacteria bacterium]|nr:PAS domain-containing sensor histidine kinase [Deltaproteobacteria bacterium]